VAVNISRERLAFNAGRPSVPGRSLAEAAIRRDARARFATATFAQPRDWGYAGLLAFTAMLLLRPQDEFPVLNPLHLAEICAVIGLAPMLLHRLTRRLPVCRVTGETIGLFLFGGAMLATAPFSVWPGGAFQEFTDSYLKILLVFVLMLNTLTTPKRLEQLTWLILVCLGYIAARGVFDYARGVNLIEGGRLAGPVSGILGNPNDLASTMVTFVPPAAVMALSKRYATRRRLAAALIVSLMLATTIFTKSRGGAIGLAAALGALVILGRLVRPRFGLIALSCILVAAPMMPTSFWQRMSSIVSDEEDAKYYTGSREARRIVMQEGIDTFVERPLTGVGAGQFKNYNPPQRRERWRETHNALIQVAAETGIVGLLAFTFLIVRAVMAAWWTLKKLKPKWRRRQQGAAFETLWPLRDRGRLSDHMVGMTAGLVGWFACAMFASVAYSWMFYYVLALIVAAREITSQRIAVVRAAETSVPGPSVVRTPLGHSIPGVA
jgi:O-antigen ligase